jgi:hypothetical protein
MDDLLRAMGEALLKELKCPVCKEYMVPPIKLCTNGHNICRCRENVNCCPKCSAEYSDIRNVAFENIARIHYPCANMKTGCSELFSIGHFAGHLALCVYGDIECPLNIKAWRCSWKGITSDFKKHADAAHRGSIIEGSALRSILYWDRSIDFLSCFGEVFVHYLGRRDGILYCAVRLIGPSNEAFKYKYKITLPAANGTEQIRETWSVKSYSEDFETIFNSGKCFRLEQVTPRNLCVRTGLQFNVEVFRSYGLV